MVISQPLPPDLRIPVPLPFLKRLLEMRTFRMSVQYLRHVALHYLSSFETRGFQGDFYIPENILHVFG
jgi:hypothetical protein